MLGAPGENKPKPNARVYSLNEGEVETRPSTMVTGQLSVANLSAYSLIDSGASHSFIAAHTSNKLEWKKAVFTQPFYTVTPAGDLYKSTSWFRNVPIKISNKVLYANLIVMEMNDYELILGMEWLSTHHAVIDCRQKKGAISTTRWNKFRVQGNTKTPISSDHLCN